MSFQDFVFDVNYLVEAETFAAVQSGTKCETQ